MKNIKPKDLDKSDLEKCGHAPSPLINGKLSTMADSRYMSCMNSPDFRRASIVSNNKSKFIDSISPKGTISTNGVLNDTSPASTFDESDDFDVVSDEHNSILESMNKYNINMGFTLISQVKENNSSSSSRHTTPLINPRAFKQQETVKKAMNIQEHLLGFLRSPKVQQPVNAVPPKPVVDQKKTNMIKNNLRHFQ